jgi:hypothetical protein
MHPLRLYVFVSLVYFSVFSLVVGRSVKDDTDGPDVTLDHVEADSVRAQLQRNLKNDLSAADMQKVDSTLLKIAKKRKTGFIDVNTDADDEGDDNGHDGEGELNKYLRLINTRGIPKTRCSIRSGGNATGATCSRPGRASGWPTWRRRVR